MVVFRTSALRRGLAATLLFAGCDREPVACDDLLPAAPQEVEVGGNVLLVVIDDVGLEAVGPWGEGIAPAPTPTMDCLCERGATFTQAWAAPSCSPARAALLTGQYPRRHDFGTILRDADTHELPLEAVTAAEVFGQAGYRTGFFGKWHLSTASSPSHAAHPNLQGFDVFDGTMGNLRQGGALELGYDRWERIVNGVTSIERGYVTSETVDAAIGFVEQAEADGAPWFAVVSFHAGHIPRHEPPAALTGEDLPGDASERALFVAMIEALDTELGRLLGTLAPEVLARTHIVAVSDNGTPDDVLPAASDFGGKGTVEESGLRVPLVVAGPAVAAPGVRDQAVHAVDVLPTLASLAGIPLDAPVDGLDLAPLLADPAHRPDRAAILGERWGPVGAEWAARRSGVRAVRDDAWKLVVDDDGVTSLHRLSGGLEDGPDLLGGPLDDEAAAALERLRQADEALEAALAE